MARNEVCLCPPLIGLFLQDQPWFGRGDPEIAVELNLRPDAYADHVRCIAEAIKNCRREAFEGKLSRRPFGFDFHTNR